MNRTLLLIGPLLLGLSLTNAGPRTESLSLPLEARLAHSEDGNWSAELNADSELIVRKIPSGEIRWKLPKNRIPLEGIQFSKDSKKILVHDAAGTLTLWDLSTPGAPSRAFRMRTDTDPLVASLISPKGWYVAGLYSRTLVLWNTKTGKSVFTFELPNGLSALSIAFSPDGSLLALNTHSGPIFVFQTVQWNWVATLERPESDAVSEVQSPWRAQ